MGPAQDKPNHSHVGTKLGSVSGRTRSRKATSGGADGSISKRSSTEAAPLPCETARGLGVTDRDTTVWSGGRLLHGHRHAGTRGSAGHPSALLSRALNPRHGSEPPLQMWTQCLGTAARGQSLPGNTKSPAPQSTQARGEQGTWRPSKGPVQPPRAQGTRLPSWGSEYTYF